ncbi:MAG TPA: hypothetical protein VKQ36_09090 [Ktedonobacterales bacterium]|nr:hypothetical protein [Ktedonobacterales bacterium]
MTHHEGFFPWRLSCGLIVTLALFAALLTSAPSAFASAPGPSTPVPVNPGARSVADGYVAHNAQWLAAKLAYRV